MVAALSSGAVLDDGSSTDSDYYYGEDKDCNLVPISTGAKAVQSLREFFPASSVTDGAKKGLARSAFVLEPRSPISAEVPDAQSSSREEGEVTCDEHVVVSSSSSKVAGRRVDRTGLAFVVPLSTSPRDLPPCISQHLRLNTPSPRGSSIPSTWSPTTSDSERRRSAQAKVWQASELSRDITRRDASQRPATRDAAARPGVLSLEERLSRPLSARRVTRDTSSDPKARRVDTQRPRSTGDAHQQPRVDSGARASDRRVRKSMTLQQYKAVRTTSASCATEVQASSEQHDDVVVSSVLAPSCPGTGADRGYSRTSQCVSSWRDARRDPRQPAISVVSRRSSPVQEYEEKPPAGSTRDSSSAKAESRTHSGSRHSRSPATSRGCGEQRTVPTAGTHSRPNAKSRKRPHADSVGVSRSRFHGVDDGFVDDVRRLKLKVLFVEQELETPTISDHARSFLLLMQRSLREVEKNLCCRYPAKFSDVYKSVSVTQDEISHYRQTRGFGNRVENYLQAQASLDRHELAKDRSKEYLNRNQRILDEIHAELLAVNPALFARVVKEFNAANSSHGMRMLPRSTRKKSFQPFELKPSVAPLQPSEEKNP